MTIYSLKGNHMLRSNKCSDKKLFSLNQNERASKSCRKCIKNTSKKLNNFARKMLANGYPIILKHEPTIHYCIKYRNLKADKDSQVVQNKR